MSSELVSIIRPIPQRQLSLTFLCPSEPSSIAVAPEVSEMLASGCVVAMGLSGGKDSQACALRTTKYLDEVGHTGPRVLVHADLGVIEWKDSLPSCERLAAHLGLELVVVRRKAGDMFSRWRKRWEDNVLRYRELACVRLILPWSTASMRFCTAELKVSPISAALKKRFPRHAILNVSGIRRQESAARSRKPVWAVQPKLQRKRLAGATWNPILDWSLQQVLAEVRDSGLALHDAYTKYGTTRVSCAFCIMSSGHDLIASAGCAENHDVYRAMVELEAESSFAFQGNRWLADVAPHLLSPGLRLRILEAKRVAELRREIESEIPKHLLYTKGWPTAIPAADEAAIIARVRRRVSDLLHLSARYLTAESVRGRYADLMEEKRRKEETARRTKSA